MAEKINELQAVNIMLSAIGETPVNSLDASVATADVSIAQSILAEVSRDVQADGYNFNTDWDVVYTPDVDGFITIPDNVIAIDSYFEGTPDLVERYGKLYNRDNKTDVFTQPVRVNLTYLLNYEDLPEAARNYIAKEAACVFYARTLQTDVPTKLERETLKAKVRFEHACTESEDYNVLNSPSIQRGLNRRL